MRYRVIAAVLGTLALLGFGATAALAHGQLAASQVATSTPSAGVVQEPALAATGYDFTPMLVTAGVVLLIAGITVLVAKYLLARSSHS